MSTSAAAPAPAPAGAAPAAPAGPAAPGGVDPSPAAGAPAGQALPDADGGPPADDAATGEPSARGTETANIEDGDPGWGNRHEFVREAQQRFTGDAVTGDKFVFYLSTGQASAPPRALSPSLQDLARFAFVSPDGWDELRHDFRPRRTVLLRGTAGHGRTTMAIRLLQTVEASVVYELDPHIDLPRMAEQLAAERLTPGTAFLLCQPEDIGSLDAYTFQGLEAVLTAADSRLVITVGQEAVLRDDGLLRYQLSLPDAPDRRDILLQHLSHLLDDEIRAAEILAARDVAELVGETLDRDGVTCEATAVLAFRLSQAGDTVDAAWVRAQLRRRHADEFEMWFDGLGNLELRCFAIALAALDGLPYEEVARAAGLLHERLADGGPLTLDGDALRITKTDPFRTTPARLLRVLQARTTETTVLTPYGYAPVTTIAYRDDRYAQRVIERVWQGYRVQDELLEWLGDLVVSPSDQVRVYAATTVGALAKLAFEYVRRHVLQPWARSEIAHEREAVADALRFVACVPGLQTAATWLVDGWYRSAGAEMQATAAYALGTRLGQPTATRAIQALERLAKTDDAVVQIGIGRGFTAMLADDAEGLTPLFYGVIERCLADPKRTVTAQVVFLLVADSLYTEEPHPGGSFTRRPTLLHLATLHAHLRRPLFQFWARALAGGGRIELAHLVLRHWAEIAEPNPATLAAFTRMVRGIADIDPLASSAIRRLAYKWNSDDELIPMPNVARAVSGVLPYASLER